MRYSFTLLERDETGFRVRVRVRVRVQTDNTGQPFDINESSKLELGSTAKLRVLVTYLEVIAELHERHTGLPVESLSQVEVEQRDVLTRWVIDRLIAEPDLALRPLLDAAMQRCYSASPREAFFTGGGRHTFSNFRREDDDRYPGLDDALRESLNLPFVRLLRDLVDYTTYQGENHRQLLEDDDDPRRQAYLAHFADREGQVIDSRARNRTATFVFHLGQHHFGTLTAYVAGQYPPRASGREGNRLLRPPLIDSRDREATLATGCRCSVSS